MADHWCLANLDEYANAPSLPWESMSPDTAVDARRTHPSENGGITKGYCQNRYRVIIRKGGRTGYSHPWGSQRAIYFIFDKKVYSWIIEVPIHDMRLPTATEVCRHIVVAVAAGSLLAHTSTDLFILSQLNRNPVM